MKELTVYINFFRKNLILILTPAFLVCVLAFSFQQEKDTVFKLTTLLEFEHKGFIEQTNLLSSQAVTFLRSKSLNEMLGLGKESKLIVYQPGPLLIQIELESTSPDSLKLSQKKIIDFIESRYKVKKVGEDVYQTLEPNVYIPTFLGFLTGGFFGIIIALFKTYLKNF